MNAIEIIFTGVVYLLGPGESPARLQAIIPNAAMPSAPYGHVIPDHYAYVKVRTSDVYCPEAMPKCFDEATEKRRPDFVYSKDHDVDSPEIALFALHGDEVGILGLKDVPLTTCEEEDCGRKMAVLGDNEKDQKVAFKNIPDQSLVCGNLCGSLNEVYKTSPDGDLVVARMTVRHGVLSASDLDDKEWLFKPGTHAVLNPPMPYHHQLIADQAVLTAETDGDIFLTITPFNADQAKMHTLKLQLKPGAHIEIGNMMPNDILPMHAQHPPEAVDFHFGLFYKMLNAPVPLDPPIPHRTVLPEMNAGGPRQNCSPLKAKG